MTDARQLEQAIWSIADGRSTESDMALFHADVRASLAVLDRRHVDPFQHPQGDVVGFLQRPRLAHHLDVGLPFQQVNEGAAEGVVILEEEGTLYRS